MTRLLIIGGWDEVVNESLKLFSEVIIFQNHHSITEFQIDNTYQSFIFDYTNEQKALNLAIKLHKEQKIRGVISLTEFGLRTASLIKTELGIAGTPIQAVENTLNKNKLREVLTKHSLDKTRFCLCGTLEEAKIFYKELNKKVILKPVKGGGSIGVASADTEKSLYKAWEWSFSQSDGKVIVEEFIEGKEYSVETISSRSRHKLLGITEKVTTEDPHFVEIGHKVPCQLTKLVKLEIEKKIVGLLNLIGNEDGPAHTEIKITETNEIFIIESQTRVGGDRIWELLQLATGINQIQLTLQNLLMPLEISQIKPDFNKFFAINYFFDERELLDFAARMKHLGILYRYHKNKQTSEGKISSLTRKGYVILYSSNLDDIRLELKGEVTNG